MVLIFVKVDGSMVSPLEVLLSDKVGDVVKRVSSKRDVYVTHEGRVLRRSEELRSCGVKDGTAMQVATRVRGGRKHKDKKSKAEKKQAASPKKAEPLHAGAEGHSTAAERQESSGSRV